MMIYKQTRVMEEEKPPEGGGGGGGAPPAAAPVDWAAIKSGLPAELAADPALGPITNVEGLVKSYIHAQKSFGKDKIVVPDKHATPEDWKGVFNKLGVPEKIDDYKMNLEGIEVNEDVLGKVKAVAHSKGVLPWQLEAVVKEFGGVAQQMHEAQQAEEQAKIDADINALKQSWGAEFDNQVKRANAAMRHLLPDAKDQQALIDAGFGTNPAMLRLLAGASKLLNEDAFIGQGEGKLAGITPEEALQKARAMQGDPNHPYRNPTHPNHLAAKKEVANLYAIAFPE